MKITFSQNPMTYTTDQPVFDIMLSEVQEVTFPWYYFGAGCVLRINGAKYKLSFIQPGNTAGGEYVSIPEARRKGQRWKAALAHSEYPK